METYLYKLKFLTPLHLSSDPLSLGKSEVMLHSDTLFSAIANSYLMLFEKDSNFVTEPPFTISSAFPYYGNTLFIKKPLKNLNLPYQEFIDLRKKIKKADFISMNLFEKFASGEEIHLTGENFAENGFITDNPIKEDIFTSGERPRASVPRTEGDTTIFYSNAIYFGGQSGLYFFATFDNEDAKKKFESALYLLGDSGVGGERAAGYGRFNFQSPGKFTFPEEEGDYFVSLSLYYPTEKEIKSGILEGARYAIITRQNWIFSGKARPIRSKSVKMFAEGSIFKNSFDAKGKIADTTPEIAKIRLNHRIIRNGKLFKLPVSGKVFNNGRPL